MIRFAGIAVIVIGCATHSPAPGADEPTLSGDPCAAQTTATSCQNDAACMWFGTGCGCPPDDPTCVCSPGTCASIDDSGSGSGSSVAAAACSCPDGGVCYEQLGGSGDPQIACAMTTPESGDPCAWIVGQGTCVDAPNVTGLCLCNNGM